MSSYENQIIEILKKDKIKFIREKTFRDLKKGLFRFDFYIQNYQGAPVIIEVDGEQHFQPIYGRQAFKKAQEHDRLKNSYCLARGIKLYRIPYWDMGILKESKQLFEEKYLVTSKWHNDNLTIPQKKAT